MDEKTSRDDSRNPSNWSERLPFIALAAIGLGIATYLACYQLGMFSQVWDPFFKNGSPEVLHSKLSTLLPVPDAALGALGYAAEILTGAIGGKTRWRTKPWVVVAFGVVAMGMALAGAVLVICQPLVAHAWCTLCLCSAAVSFVVVGPAIRESRVAWRHLKTRREHHNSLGPAEMKMKGAHGSSE